MATQNTAFTILNLRDGGEIKLLFPQEVNTEDRANWHDVDVAGGVKPLFFANVEPQKITISELCIDNTQTNESVEPTIEKLRSWMRPKERQSSPPVLQILTVGWQQRCVLSGLNVKRSFATKPGVYIRAFLTLTFEEVSNAGLQIDTTTTRRSGNSISGRTTR